MCGQAVNGCRVIRMQPRQMMPPAEGCTMETYQQASHLVLQHVARHDAVAQQDGIVLLVDFEGFSSVAAVRCPHA